METPAKFDALKRFGNNVFTFFSGITLGLVIGASVTFYYLDSKIQANLNHGNNEKNQIGLISKFLEFAEKTNPFIKKKTDSTEVKKQEQDKTVSDNNHTAKTDSLETLSNAAPDSLQQLGSDDILADDGSVVKKDEMLFSKQVEIYEISKNYGSADSANAVGSRPRQIAGRMWVEFWRSPLNYKGYKYGRTKLVVYGIFDYEGVKMLKLGDELFLRHNTSFYRVANAANFVPFMKVSDDLTLIELNQF